MFKANQIIEAIDGKLLKGKPDTIFSKIVIDSRNANDDDLFIPIRGQRYDGHDFINKFASVKKTSFLLEDKKMNNINLSDIKSSCIITVADTHKAFLDISKFHKERIHPKLIAITGSNGKTTVKEMCGTIFRKHYATYTSFKNYNNLIGVPLNLLNLKKEHECAILEFGMNHTGEIRALTKTCSPDIALINNIAPAHIGEVGSIEKIKEAKFEIFEGLKKTGIKILNYDDKMLQPEFKKDDYIGFGLDKNADIKAKNIKVEEFTINFDLILPDKEKANITLKIGANFMVYNALAAATVAYLCDIPIDIIKKGLEEFKNVEGRMNLIKGKNNINIVDDCYNANPVSMEASLLSFAHIKKDKKAFVVMGDMLELGAKSAQYHFAVGKVAGKKNFDKIYIFGDFATEIKRGALSSNFDDKKIFIGSKEKIAKDLNKEATNGDWILFKASRGKRLEDIIKTLI